MINLRSLNTNANTNSTMSDFQHFSRFSTPNFRMPPSFLGNIGETLDHGLEEEPSELAALPAGPSPVPPPYEESLSQSGWNSIFDSDKNVYGDSIPNIPVRALHIGRWLKCLYG